MKKQNVVVKKNTSEHLAPGGRGWHEVPGEGVLNKEYFIGTPSSPLRGTSPASGEVNGGFTLIELLVVVLIIGILAAVAVPQYKKAVIKSQNAEMKQIVRVVADAERAYFLTNGKYAANFNELDVDIPLTPVKTTVGSGVGTCDTGVRGTDSARQGKNYYVALNITKADQSLVSVVSYWSIGPYSCAGFGIVLESKTESKTFHCREMSDSERYKAGQGAFCEKIEQGTFFGKSSDSGWRYYRLP